MVWRTLKIFTLIGLGLGFLVAQAPSVNAELPSNDGSPPVVVIVLSTHVFNARDLPLAGPSMR